MRRILHDITRPVGEGIPGWPGDAPFRMEWTLRTRDGESVNLSQLHLSPHTGTHADAPYHSSDEGARIGELPLDPFVGEALVVVADGCAAVTPEQLGPVLRASPVNRILVRTGCWESPNRFPERIPPVDPRAVELLASAGVRLYGTDAPSVDELESKDLPAHAAMRRSGIHNLESLLLDGVEPGRYELIALPLRLMEADGSPIRAVLRSLGE